MYKKMYLSCTVQIPAVKGRICRQRTKCGTYIHYILERSYNPKTQQTAPKRVLIGKRVDDTETMVPNENFRLYFPDAVLPEVRELAYRCSTLMVGSFIAIDSVVKHYDLESMLKKQFENRTGLLLDLAAYMIVEQRNQGQYFPDYAYRHPLFSNGMRIASDTTISDFLASITPDQIAGFLNDWNAKHDHRSRIYISYDSTNKNTQAGNIDFAEFGKAKVDQGCPIVNIGVAFDQTNQKPLFYESYPGSINDVSQLQFLVKKAVAYNYKHIGFILDRGYFSKHNIAYMDENKFAFIMMVRGCKALVAELVDELHGTFETHCENALRTHHLHGTTKKRKLFQEDDKERYFHVFFNPMKMALERQELDDILTQMQKSINQCIGMEVEFSAPHTDYFNFVYDENKRLLFAEEKKDVTRQAYLRCGYFCIITSEKMSAEEAYLLYRGRDVSEKFFRADKSFLGSKSMRVHEQESMNAKIFIEFIALIIRQRIFNLLKDQMLKLPTKQNYLTVPAALKELDKLELTRVNDGMYQLDHQITRTQEIILSSFGMTKEQAANQCAGIAAAIAEAEKKAAPKKNTVSNEGEIMEDNHDGEA